MSRKGKSMETESRWVFAWAGAGGEGWQRGMRDLWGGRDRKVLNLIAVVVTQLYTFTKNH